MIIVTKEITIDLNGYALIIGGDLINSGGDIDIGNGALKVGGDCSIVGAYEVPSRVTIANGGRFTVLGDMTIGTTWGRHKQTVYNNGILEVCGSLALKSSIY